MLIFGPVGCTGRVVVMWADFIIGVFMYLIPIIAVLWLLCDVVVFIGRLLRRLCNYISKKFGSVHGRST